MALIKDASVACRLLNGIFCVYKPAGVTKTQVRHRILFNVSQDLCEMKCRDPIDYVYIEGDPEKSLTVNVAPSYADLPQVIGPRYQPKDFKCRWSTQIGKNVSGVMVLGMGSDGIKSALRFDNGRPIRVYHVSGRLGKATEDCFLSESSRIIDRATYKNVKRTGIDRILASIQANFQQQVFHQIGVDPESQAAYDLAVQGPIRPWSREMTVVYGMKCIDFNPPDFVVEVHCINETQDFLARLILDVAMKHHSVAACTGIRCLRHGPFTFQDALLSKHWRLDHIINSMTKCGKILKSQPDVAPALAPLVDISNKEAESNSDKGNQQLKHK